MATDTPKGLFAITLNGDLLESVASDAAVRERAQKQMVQTADGAWSEYRAWHGQVQLDNPSLLFPDYRKTFEFRFSWEALVSAGFFDRVEELLSAAGPHTLSIWRPITLAYTCDGSRNRFFVPWVLANEVESTLPPRAGSTPTRFDPKVKVTRAGDVLTYLSKGSGAYPGTPASDEVWWLDSGHEFKLATAPASGTKVYARIYPQVYMLERPDVERPYTGRFPHREARTIDLVEASRTLVLA